MFKYIFYYHSRISFLKQKNCQQLYYAIDQIFNTNILLIKFDQPTGSLHLEECNEQALRFLEEKDETRFLQFISTMVVNVKAPKNISKISLKTQAENEWVSLKRYLTKQFKQLALEQNVNEDFVKEKLLGKYKQGNSLTEFKVNIGILNGTEPLIIVSFSDLSEEGYNKALKDETVNLKALCLLSQSANEGDSNAFLRSLQLNSEEMNTMKLKQAASYIKSQAIKECLNSLFPRKLKEKIYQSRITLEISHFYLSQLLQVVESIFPMVQFDYEKDIDLSNFKMSSDLAKLKFILFSAVLKLINIDAKIVKGTNPSMKHKECSRSSVIEQQEEDDFLVEKQSINDDDSLIRIRVNEIKEGGLKLIHFKLSRTIPQENSSPDSRKNSEQVQDDLIRVINDQVVQYYVGLIGRCNDQSIQVMENKQERSTFIEFEVLQKVEEKKNQVFQNQNLLAQMDMYSQQQNIDICMVSRKLTQISVQSKIDSINQKNINLPLQEASNDKEKRLSRLLSFSKLNKDLILSSPQFVTYQNQSQLLSNENSIRTESPDKKKLKLFFSKM